jgi:hypothetical protein
VIIVREVVGVGQSLLATGQYQELTHSTDAISGYATLSVKLPQSVAAANAGIAWRGRKLAHLSKDGLLWEGRIERAATDGEWVTVEAVGEGPAILTKDSYAFMAFDNALTGSGEWDEVHDQEPDVDGKETSTKFILQQDEVKIELGIKAGPTPKDEEAFKDNIEYSTGAAILAAGWDAIGTPTPGTGPSGAGGWDGSWVYGNIMGGAEDNHTFNRNIYMNQGGGTPGYFNNENSAMWSPVINLSSYAGVVEGFTLKWWSRIVTAGPNDYGEVQVSKNNGTNWTTVAGPFHSNSGANAVPEWTEYAIELDATHAVSQLRVRWRFQADATTQQVGGWRIDDVEITAHPLQKQVIIEDELTYLRYQNPYVWSGTRGIRWVKIDYHILKTLPNLKFQIIAANASSSFTLVDVAVTAGSTVTYTVTESVGTYDRIYFQLKAVGGEAVHYGEDGIYVEVTKFERSQVAANPPKVQTALQRIFTDAGVAAMYPSYLAAPDITLTKPVVVPTGSTFKSAIDAVMQYVQQVDGDEWIYGVWKDGKFDLTNKPRRMWKVGENDAGTVALMSVLGPGSQNIGRATSASYSHVRARYLSTVGEVEEVRFTASQATGIDTGYTRTLEIDAGKVTEAEAILLAQGQAAKLADRSPRGTITLRGFVRSIDGGVFPVSAVQAGDWILLDAVSATQALKREDTQRGGFIGKTTYNGDTDEVVVELLGNFND